jgi:hypothetical protein
MLIVRKGRAEKHKSPRRGRGLLLGMLVILMTAGVAGINTFCVASTVSPIMVLEALAFITASVLSLLTCRATLDWPFIVWGFHKNYGFGDG